MPAASPSARPALRRLLARLRPHRRAVALGVVLSLGGSAAAVVQPLAAREVLEATAAGRPVLAWIAALLAIVLLAAAANTAGAFVMDRTAEGVVRDARRTIVDRILGAPILRVGEHAGGDLVSRVVSDTTLLRGSGGQALSGLAGAALTIVVSLIIMATIDLVLLGVTIGVVVVLTGAFGLLLPRIARDMTAGQEAVGELGARLEPVVRHLRTVKASGEEERERRALGALTDAAYTRGVSAARATAVVTSGGEMAAQIAFLAALGVGGARAASGAIAVPDLIAFLLYLMLLVAPLALVSMALSELQAAVAADARLRPIEELAPERETVDPDRTGGPAPTTTGPLVAFDGVTVRAGERTILEAITLAVPEGGVTGVVGPSGAGKTTLLELLCAFREPDAGTLRIAGAPVDDWPLTALRRTTAYVEQDAPIVPGTLGENLRYGAPDAGDAEVDRVLEELGLDRLVAALPEALDTTVGPGGRPLSGGERQRVAIARALLRRPRLLLFDEASSQLDARSEAALRRAIDVAAQRCTVFVVAHRLATVAGADRIVVLDDGRVRAVGTHAELLLEDTLYRSLAAAQGMLDAAAA